MMPVGPSPVKRGGTGSSDASSSGWRNQELKSGFTEWRQKALGLSRGKNGSPAGRSSVLWALLPLYGRFNGASSDAPPYDSGRAGPSGANVVGCRMRSLSISRIHAGECQVESSLSVNDLFFWRAGPRLQSWGERLPFSPCCARRRTCTVLSLPPLWSRTAPLAVGGDTAVRRQRSGAPYASPEHPQA